MLLLLSIVRVGQLWMELDAGRLLGGSEGRRLRLPKRIDNVRVRATAVVIVAAEGLRGAHIVPGHARVRHDSVCGRRQVSARVAPSAVHVVVTCLLHGLEVRATGQALTLGLGSADELLGLLKAGLAQVGTASALVALAAERWAIAELDAASLLHGRHADLLLERAAHFNVAI